MADEKDSMDLEQNQGADTPQDESQPAGGSRKTYTPEELDAEIKRRIDKQNAKHAAEMESLQARLDALEETSKADKAELDEMRAEKERQQWLQAAADETGVPASLIRGESAEEMMAHAKAIQSVLPSYPTEHRGSDSAKPATRESILAIKNEKERLAAIREHAELWASDSEKG